MGDEKSDYRKRLEAVDAWLAPLSVLEDEQIEAKPFTKVLFYLGAAVERHVPFLLGAIRAVETALTAAGIPSDGRAPAERIGDLVAALRAAKVLGADGTLGEAAADILRAADMIRRVEHGATVEHRCADSARCPLCSACARGEHRRAGETMPGSCADCGVDWADLDTEDEPQAGGLGLSPAEAAARYPDALAGLTEEQRQHLTALADPVFRARFNGSTARIAVRGVPTRVGFNKEFGLSITAADLARALGISEEDMAAIEAGAKATNDAGWAEIQTALFLLGSGTAPEHIADPASSPAFERAMEREDEDDNLEASSGEGRETWSTSEGQGARLHGPACSGKRCRGGSEMCEGHLTASLQRSEQIMEDLRALPLSEEPPTDEEDAIFRQIEVDVAKGKKNLLTVSERGLLIRHDRTGNRGACSRHQPFQRNAGGRAASRHHRPRRDSTRCGGELRLRGCLGGGR